DRIVTSSCCVAGMLSLCFTMALMSENLLPGLGPACWCSCRLGEARPARAAGWGWPAGGLLGRPVLISGFRIVRLCRPASSFVSASACAFAPSARSCSALQVAISERGPYLVGGRHLAVPRHRRHRHVQLAVVAQQLVRAVVVFRESVGLGVQAHASRASNTFLRSQLFSSFFFSESAIEVVRASTICGARSPERETIPSLCSVRWPMMSGTTLAFTHSSTAVRTLL